MIKTIKGCGVMIVIKKKLFLLNSIKPRFRSIIIRFYKYLDFKKFRSSLSTITEYNQSHHIKLNPIIKCPHDPTASTANHPCKAKRDMTKSIFNLIKNISTQAKAPSFNNSQIPHNTHQSNTFFRISL